MSAAEFMHLRLDDEYDEGFPIIFLICCSAVSGWPSVHGQQTCISSTEVHLYYEPQ